MPLKIAEQISAYEGQRKTASDAMSALMSKASEEGRTLDEAEAKEYDGHETTVKAIGEHVVRLQRLEQQNKEAALADRGQRCRRRRRLARRLARPIEHHFGQGELPAGHGFHSLLSRDHGGQGQSA